MKNKEQKEHQELGKKLRKGLEESYKKMVEFKKYKKTPLVVSQNGKVIEIPYQDIPPIAKYI